MSLTVVVGGQYGSEGKGKMVSWLCRNRPISACIRTGGPNAGHTVDFAGRKHISRQLPSGYVQPGVNLIIGPGGMIDVPLLVGEVEKLEGMGYDIWGRLMVDPMAAIVPGDACFEEVSGGFSDRFGSTQTGTGWTTAMRILRNADKLRLAKDHERLRSRLHNTAAYCHSILNIGHQVILEGTQGFGLSMLHGGHWPYCTSRDTSVLGFLSEAGISYNHVSTVIQVIRTYPIRVGGNSGPIRKEIDWPTVHERCGMPEELRAPEITSVTKKVRRVGEFDWELLHRSTMINQPNYFAVHGLDYLCWANRGVTEASGLTEETLHFLELIRARTGTRVRWGFTGPRDEDIVTFF